MSTIKKELTNLEKLRVSYASTLEAKKTLNKLELFDYIMSSRKSDAKSTSSGCIKKLRIEGYSISQSRVFDIFKDIEKMERLDLESKLSTADKKKLLVEEKKTQSLQEEMKKLQDKLDASKKLIDKVVK